MTSSSGIGFVLEMGWRLLASKVTGARDPLFAVLTLTHRCNLHCEYCRIWEDPPEEMTTSEVLSLIDGMAEAGIRRLSLLGGEPMVRKDIGTVVDHAKGRGMQVVLCSNGLRVEHRVEELRGLDLFATSMDGPEEVHDAIRGKGTHAQTLRAIRACVAVGIPSVSAVTLTRKSIESIPYLFDLARREGHRIAFNPVMEMDFSTPAVPELVLDEETFRRTIRSLIAYKRQGAPMIGSTALYEFFLKHWRPDHRMLAANGHPGPTHAGVLPCQATRYFCLVSPDGRLHSCEFLPSRAEAPNARELGFAEAFSRLSAPKCNGCWCLPYVEANLTLGLNPASMLNVFQMVREML